MRPSFSKKLLLPAVALLTLSFGGTAAAAEVVLVPLIIYPPGSPGQNGALWVTDFTMENYGDREWWESGVAGYCGFSGFGLGPHSTFKNPFCAPGIGALLEIDEDQLIRFQLRIRDAASAEVCHGTEIPVVRAADALQGPSTILDLPATHAFRRTIRVYNFSRSVPFRFTLKIRPLLSTDAVFESTHEVPRSWPPVVPSLVRLDDGTEIPNLDEYGTVKIEIVPESDEGLYWWFISLASNTTNELTIATPQQKGRRTP